MPLHVNQLDQHSLQAVFEYLSVQQLISIERVCKLWQSQVVLLLKQQKALTTLDNDIKRHRLDHEQCSDPTHSCQLASVGRVLTALTVSGVYSYRRLRIDNLKKILLRCPNLEAISLNQKFTLEEVAEMFEVCPKLKCLDVKMAGGEWSSHWLQLFADRKLKHLRIDFSGCMSVVDYAKQELVLVDKLVLEELIIIGFAGFEVINFVKNIKELRRFYYKPSECRPEEQTLLKAALSNSLLEILRWLALNAKTSIQHLDLDLCLPLCSIEHDLQLSHLATSYYKFANLRFVSLTINPSFELNSLSSWLKSLTRLDGLSIASVKNFQQQQLDLVHSVITGVHSNLKYLKLCNFMLMAEIFETIATHWKSLHRLDLVRCCSDFSRQLEESEKFWRLLASMQNLCHLTLCRCDIKGQGFEQIASSNSIIKIDIEMKHKKMFSKVISTAKELATNHPNKIIVVTLDQKIEIKSLMPTNLRLISLE